MPETILVTGAAGFIGSHLSRALLARGARVVGVDCFDPFYDRAQKEANVADLRAHAGFTLVEADIVDRPRMRGLAGEHRPAAFVHLAALAGVRPSIERPTEYVRVNVDGTAILLEAARDAGCSRFLFASSSSVYGNCRTVPFSETADVTEPISPYAATKKAGELICHAWAHLFGTSIASLRFFTVYGPGQRPDLAIHKFMRRIARDEAIEMFGDGTTSRDYTYVDDIVAGVLAALDWTSSHPATHRIFNLGGSSPVSLTEMIEAIGRTVGRTPRIERRPMQPGDVERTWADVARSETEIGYRPATPFEEGLRRQWAWLQERIAAE